MLKTVAQHPEKPNNAKSSNLVDSITGQVAVDAQFHAVQSWKMNSLAALHPLAQERAKQNHTSIDPKQLQNDSFGPIWTNISQKRFLSHPRANRFINDFCRHRHR